MWPFSRRVHSYDPVATSIGNVLKDMGLISDADLREAASQQTRHKEKIGDVLIRMGVLTRDQLVHGLDVQRALRTQGQEYKGQLEILKAQARKRVRTSTELQAAYQSQAHG